MRAQSGTGFYSKTLRFIFRIFCGVFFEQLCFATTLEHLSLPLPLAQAWELVAVAATQLREH